MNQSRKWAWLALGVGGILLAVVSTRFVFQSDTAENSVLISGETEKTPAGDEPFEMDEAEVSKLGASAMEAKPPAGRIMPSEIEREDIDRGSRGRQGRLGGLEGRDWKPRVDTKGALIPEVRDAPPLQLNEPTGIDPARGRKQAWNDVDPAGGAEPADGGGDSNYWQAPVEAEPSVPADDFGSSDLSPPPPTSDLEGDFQAEPRDDSAFGGD